MKLQFTNRQICFATSQCFGSLHFRLQTHLQDLLLVNSEDDHVQDVTITPEQLVQVYKSVSTIPEGEARKINGEMKASLIPQLLGAAGLPIALNKDNQFDEAANGMAIMELAQTGIQDNEGLNALLLILAADQQNDGVAEAKIAAGKEQILRQ